jgi:tetratricopeptide (TPR) repeat protein
LLLVSKLALGQPAVPRDVVLLYRQLKQSKADTARVSLLIKICRYDNANFTRHPALLDSAMTVAGRAKTLSDKLGYPEGSGLSCQLMAQAWVNKKDFKKSAVLIKKAISIFLSNNLYRDAAEAYLNMQDFYLASGGTDLRVRIAYYEQAQPLFHKVGAYAREGATLCLLGDYYQWNGDFDHALEKLTLSLAAYKKVNERQLQSVYDLLGRVNRYKCRYHEALKYGLLAEKPPSLTTTAPYYCARSTIG